MAVLASANFARLRALVEKQNKRSQRTGCAPIVVTETRRFMQKRVVDRDLGIEREIPYVEFTIEGEAPVIPGHTFIGTIQFLEGAALMRAAPGQTIPVTFREATPICNHCNTNRRRNDVFIFADENGDHLQVGRTCMQDFFGHHSPEALLAFADMWRKVLADADDDDVSGCDWRATSWPLEHFLAYVAAEISAEGWVSRGAAKHDYSLIASADAAWEAMCGMREREGRKHHLPSQADKDTAAAAIAWAQSITNPRSDFEHNMSAMARVDAVDFRASGIAGAIVNSYRTAMLRQQQAKQNATQHANSQHVGAIKDKVDCEVTCMFSMRKEGGYGTYHINKFTDPNGNVLVWFGQEPCEVGKRYSLRGKVKAHSTFQGVATTQLNYVKIEAK